MATVIRRRDGSTMVVYSRQELRDIMRERRIEMGAPGIRAAERGR